MCFIFKHTYYQQNKINEFIYVKYINQASFKIKKSESIYICSFYIYIYIFYKNMIEKFLINLFKIVNVSVFRTGLDDFIFEEQYKVEFKKFKTSTYWYIWF